MKTDAVFCDDIRQEVSGKGILVGVYGDEMIPSRVPTTVHMGFWIKLSGLSKGTHNVELEITGTGSERKIGTTITPTIDRGDEGVVIALSGWPVRITESTVLRAFLDVDGERTEVASLPINTSEEARKMAQERFGA